MGNQSSGERFRVEYRLYGSAERLCADQTIEAPVELLQHFQEYMSLLGNLAQIFPTAAGQMGEDRIAEMYETFGREVAFILGSQIRQDASGIAGACKKFMATLEQAAR